jgi:hypothetical protein
MLLQKYGEEKLEMDMELIMGVSWALKEGTRQQCESFYTCSTQASDNMNTKLIVINEENSKCSYERTLVMLCGSMSA